MSLNISGGKSIIRYRHVIDRKESEEGVVGEKDPKD